MSEQTERKITLGDVEILVGGCGHCSKDPSDEEAVVAVRRAEEFRKCAKLNCSFCGESIRCMSYRIRHDSEGFIASEVKIEPAIGLRFDGEVRIYDYNGLHLRCVRKALPFIRGFDVKDLLR